MEKRIITNVDNDNENKRPFSEIQPSQEERESLIRRIQESEIKDNNSTPQDN